MALALGAAAGPDRDPGAAVYTRACAACHGADGSGGAVPASYPGFAALMAPAVVGTCALGRFANAAELLAYVRYDMPLEAPGSLSDEEARAVVALLLARNGIPAADPLTLARASAIDLAGRRAGPACPGR
jgi:cytochrome c